MPRPAALEAVTAFAAGFYPSGSRRLVAPARCGWPRLQLPSRRRARHAHGRERPHGRRPAQRVARSGARDDPRATTPTSAGPARWRGRSSGAGSAARSRRATTWSTPSARCSGARAGPGEFARIFQAFRIAVNDELGGLARALEAFRDALVAGRPPGGDQLSLGRRPSREAGVPRLEHRVHLSAGLAASASAAARPRVTLVTRRAIVASDAESAANPRARSAHLRVFQVNDEA